MHAGKTNSVQQNVIITKCIGLGNDCVGLN